MWDPRNLQNGSNHSLNLRRKVFMIFVTTSTSRFFRILGLSEDFLQKDASEWEQHQDYIKNKALVRSIKVVNDLAERGVALMQ